MKEEAKKEAEATGFLYLYNICGCFFCLYSLNQNIQCVLNESNVFFQHSP